MSLCAAIMICIGTWFWYNHMPKRVYRQHSRTIAKDFEYLTKRIDVRTYDRSWINRWQAEKDLDELEWLLENRYSYLKLKGVDYKAALDSIRCAIGGGSRAPLRVLLPFFMADNAPPKVVNVAAYRLGHRKDILDARWLYPEDWPGWSDEERAAIEQTRKTFRPEWNPPEGEFSQWHYFVISPLQEEYYYYNRPVIILMDTTNFSASDIFLGAFKGHPNITLMGTPSGGGSGRYQLYRLRFSYIAFTLSSMASFRPDGSLYEDNGIEPDIVIEPAAIDFIGQTDTISDAAISRLTGK